MRLNVKVAACLLTLCAVQAHLVSQAADPWFVRSAKDKDFEAPKLPWNNISIELPKNWQLVPGHNGVLLTAAEKTRNNQPAAVIMLEQMRLQDTLLPKDLTDATLTFEAQSTRERDPAGQNYQQLIKQASEGRRFIFIQYTRPGFAGPDRVTQYSVPAGLILYRVICIAPEAQIAKYQATCAHVAESFRATATATKE
jgi:hypothetical protein